ncbi:MAG: hypothetical protein JOZ69_25025 [Myxococcales bacterium]|nr:hypothetical protein [Myxococcales bacterium]
MAAAPPVDRSAPLPLLPEPLVGVVESVEPVALGLSGAGVFAVRASPGAFVLRIQRRDLDPSSFAQPLRVLRPAAEAGVAPALVHVDPAARATVSAHVAGLPLTADPGTQPHCAPASAGQLVVHCR